MRFIRAGNGFESLESQTGGRSCYDWGKTHLTQRHGRVGGHPRQPSASSVLDPRQPLAAATSPNCQRRLPEPCAKHDTVGAPLQCQCALRFREQVAKNCATATDRSVRSIGACWRFKNISQPGYRRRPSGLAPWPAPGNRPSINCDSLGCGSPGGLEAHGDRSTVATTGTRQPSTCNGRKLPRG